MRGEEAGLSEISSHTTEIPPRARRRAQAERNRKGASGNTSACAEKRPPPPPAHLPARKYLRVRGEEPYAHLLTRAFSEIPPRARRRADPSKRARCGRGNTSACAEKRGAVPVLAVTFWKYLRVRGEEWFIPLSSGTVREIPPRARRREESMTRLPSWIGNTSACAEKRWPVLFCAGDYRKYLRVRGEERLGVWVRPL